MKTQAVIYLLVSLFVLGSCTTVTTSGEPIVFNDSLPDDEIAIIYFNSMVSIVGYNDIQVNWKGLFLSAREIRIPGGSAQFILNGTTGSANIGYTTYRNVPFTYNFEKGKEYTMLINQNLIFIFNGKTMSNKELLAQFNMSHGQTRVK
jgi:hypothetical protein